MLDYKKIRPHLDSFYFLGLSGIITLFLAFAILLLIPNRLIGMPEIIGVIFVLLAGIISFTVYVLSDKKVPQKVKLKVGIAFGAQILITALILLPYDPQIWITKAKPVIAAINISLISALLGAAFAGNHLQDIRKDNLPANLFILNILLVIMDILLLNSLVF